MPKKNEFKKNAKPRSVAQRKYNSKPKSKAERNARNVSRAQMVKAGKVKKGQDVDHKDHNPLNKSKKNMRPRSVAANRADNKHKTRGK